MKLQNLKIKGFKSFADKTNVSFDNQITGIVGPNGCGKSNIVDAIRWVIGENKISALRSENLGGLVFNGSKTRPASAMAEVSLTFDNDKNVLPTDFSTVTVSRKFYKNGDSEYHLNDVACRLKDIHNLFLDTGVSSDSYAIIELGMVDEIIKDKDNARRRMLEQAAGISIYKTRKKEAQSKLKSTEADLARIEDLLYEIEGNVKTLKRQAKKAQKHKEIKNEYKEVSILHAQKSLSNFNDEFQIVHKKILELEENKIRLDKELESEESGIQELKKEVEAEEQRLYAMQQEYNALMQVIAKMEQDKQLNLQKLHFQKDKSEGLDQLIKNTGDQLQQTKEELSKLEKNTLESEKSYLSQKESEEELRSALEKKKEAFAKSKEELDAQKKELSELQNEKFKYEKDFAVLETSISNIRASIALEKEEKSKRENQKNELQSELKKYEAELSEYKTQHKKLLDEQENLKAEILKNQEQLEKIRTELRDENRKLDAKQNEYGLLKSLVENLEGYPDSIKFLSKNDQWNSNPMLLSDILLPREEYRSAIEAVLNPYLNYFIAENFYQAKEAIKLLQTQKKGKANFFILDKIQEVHKMPALEGMRSAMELVEYDDKYEPLVKMLLGNVYISQEADIYSMDLQKDYTVVSADGSVQLHQLSITGGAQGALDTSKLGRAKNLEKLQADIASLSSKTASIEKIFGQTEENIKNTQQGLNNSKLDELQKQIQTKEQQIFAANTKLENLNKANQQSQSKTESLANQLEEKEAKVKEISQANNEKQSSMLELHEKLAKLDTSFIETEKAYREASDQWNVFSVELESKKSQWQNSKDSLELRKTQIANLETQLKNSQSELEETQQNIAEAQEGESKFASSIQEQVLLKNEKQDTVNRLDQDYHNRKKVLQEKDSKINAVRKKKEENLSTLADNKERLNAMKLEVSTLNERMKLEFDVALDSILNQGVIVEEKESVLEEKVQKLKSKLQSMGEINPTAIEAYEEIKKRQDFIVEQRSDLLSAKDNLLQTIQEVEDTANQKFLDTFQKVRENFIEVFQALFTEDDTADMKMTDPDNPSETGVEIYARPKGKKPSVITQLSGGEKTLTATALLFAIYLIKPAPFCILDEVDAPLDDANVEKFTNMIRKFSDNSQFIIVTHNKQTMAAVDAIYGVTMQEPGVSKLVPVDFRSLN